MPPKAGQTRELRVALRWISLPAPSSTAAAQTRGGPPVAGVSDRSAALEPGCGPEDAGGVYLLPAHRYTVEGQEYQPVVAAVTDDVIAPPPVETGRPDDSVTGDGTPTDVVPPDEGTGGGTSGSNGSAP
jgi:hypothetical protein